jgi:hypothetical protein
MFHSIPKKESTVVPPVRDKIEKPDPLHHSATTTLSLSLSLSLHPCNNQYSTNFVDSYREKGKTTASVKPLL